MKLSYIEKTSKKNAVHLGLERFMKAALSPIWRLVEQKSWIVINGLCVELTRVGERSVGPIYEKMYCRFFQVPESLKKR